MPLILPTLSQRRRDTDIGALQVFTPAARQAGVPPHRLVLDTFALAWYPLVHAQTLPTALGMKSGEPAFLEEQKQHVADLVRAMTYGPDPGRPSRK
jgi:hypothetical protein